MKTLFTTILIFIGLNTIENETQLEIDTKKSQIEWSCDYVFYFNGHYGTISFEEGHFIKTDDKITGGEFIIDMNSIVCLDIDDEESNKGLVDHLKDPDFFNVTHFPKAKLTITNVHYHDSNSMEISANMEIKDAVQPIKFQAEVDFEAKELRTKFKIDRTQQL